MSADIRRKEVPQHNAGRIESDHTVPDDARHDRPVRVLAAVVDDDPVFRVHVRRLATASPPSSSYWGRGHTSRHRRMDAGFSYRSTAPVAFATAATTFAAAASISGSVSVRSRGWNVTSTPSDFLPASIRSPS